MSDNMQELLENYIHRAFPQRTDARITHLICLNNGWESDVYAFRTEWAYEGQLQQDLQILRIYPGSDAQEKSAREFHALQTLYGAGYPVPRVDVVESAHSPFGKPFLIMELIEGHGMWGPMFHSPSLEEQQRLLSLFCSLFVRLHALDWRIFKTENQSDYASHPEMVIQDQLARWRPFVEAAPIPGLQSGWQWLLAHSRDISCDRPSLIHWDFHPENILLRKPGGAGEEAVVIDWTGLEVSDYRFDLSWTLMLIIHEGPAWRKQILENYERISGNPIRDLEFFEVAASFRRLYSVMFSLAFGAEKLGMRPGAEEQMRKSAPGLRLIYERSLEITAIPVPEIEQFLNSLQA